MGVIIKKAGPEYLNQLVDLFDAYRVFYEKASDKEGALAFLAERIQKKDSVIFLAFIENEAAGFIQLYPLFSSTQMKRMWLLNDLYTSSQYRGKGVGTALMEEAKKLCKNTSARGMYLETAKSNKEGNSLYPKVGFQIDEEHNYYYWEV